MFAAAATFAAAAMLALCFTMLAALARWDVLNMGILHGDTLNECTHIIVEIMAALCCS